MSLAFRAAVEAADHAAMVDALADDIRLHSPVAFRPFEGRDAVSQLFAALLETFEDFRYTDELRGDDGVHALIFRARVGDKQVEGLDLLRLDDEGKIYDFTVMVRPASGLMALAEAIGPKVAGAKTG
jgi:SnoaL-like protein